jgi:hypothetical protein
VKRKHEKQFADLLAKITTNKKPIKKVKYFEFLKSKLTKLVDEDIDLDFTRKIRQH